MTSSWSEITLPTILSNYKLEDIFNAGEFGLFYQYLPDKTYHLEREKCSGKKKAKSGLLEWQQQVRREKNCPYLWSGNLKIPAVSRMSSIHPVSTNHKRRVGWIVRSLKSGSVNSTKSFVQMIKKLLLSLTIVQPIHQSQTWTTFKSYFHPQIRRPFFNQWIKVSYAALKHITDEGLYVCCAEPWRKKSLVQRFQFCNQWRYWLILGRS